MLAKGRITAEEVSKPSPRSNGTSRWCVESRRPAEGKREEPAGGGGYASYSGELMRVNVRALAGAGWGLASRAPAADPGAGTGPGERRTEQVGACR